MDDDAARALSTLRAHEPEQARRTLHDTGFGDFADEWLASTQEFASQGRDVQPGEQSAAWLRAYARMRMCWFRITQLRDQARRALDQRRDD